jgi:hypothetical protein
MHNARETMLARDSPARGIDCLKDEHEMLEMHALLRKSKSVEAADNASVKKINCQCATLSSRLGRISVAYVRFAILR